MLVLSRFKGEAIVVGGNVVIEVIGVRSSGQVRLGITAPKDVTVNRREIEVAIREKQRLANNPVSNQGNTDETQKAG